VAKAWLKLAKKCGLFKNYFQYSALKSLPVLRKKITPSAL